MFTTSVEQNLYKYKIIFQRKHISYAIQKSEYKSVALKSRYYIICQPPIHQEPFQKSRSQNDNINFFFHFC